MNWYLERIGRYPLLTPSQEIELARQVQAGREPMASRARRKLFLCNLRFVVKVAKVYAKSVHFLELEDMIQHGNIGLSRAIDKFDPERGYKFSTYAHHWIMQSITAAISREEHVIRIPRDKRNQINHVKRVTSQLAQQLGRNPTLGEIAQEAGTTENACRAAALHSMRTSSLDSGAILSAVPADLPDQDDDGPEISTLLPVLPENERIIIQRYYGLAGCDPSRMAQIGDELGLSPSRISQLKQKALQRLRRAYALTLSA
jgi:RNA polymerase primary sigma factor